MIKSIWLFSIGIMFAFKATAMFPFYKVAYDIEGDIVVPYDASIIEYTPPFEGEQISLNVGENGSILSLSIADDKVNRLEQLQHFDYNPGSPEGMLQSILLRTQNLLEIFQAGKERLREVSQPEIGQTVYNTDPSETFAEVFSKISKDFIWLVGHIDDIKSLSGKNIYINDTPLDNYFYLQFNDFFDVLRMPLEVAVAPDKRNPRPYSISNSVKSKFWEHLFYKPTPMFGYETYHVAMLKLMKQQLSIAFDRASCEHWLTVGGK